MSIQEGTLANVLNFEMIFQINNTNLMYILGHIHCKRYGNFDQVYSNDIFREQKSHP
jgi:hypothetical protein